MKYFVPLFLIVSMIIGYLPVHAADLSFDVELPEKIYFKTSTASFTVDYYFILVDGKIYYKRNQDVINPELLFEVLRGQDPEGANEWKLLEPNGMAFSNHRQGIAGLPNAQPPKTKDFDTPPGIVEISADNSMLIALSEEGQFYYCYLNDGSNFYNIRGWTDRWGSPKKILKFPDMCKAWQIGRRSEKVEWFEDPAGYKRSYSGFGLSTIYALGKNGRDIYFIDNGMPQSFHDIIAGPFNGEFIAESISVSGETIFLIDKYGNMFTRLADFDSIGDDVMLYNYTYKTLPLQMPNTGRKFQASQFGKEYSKIAIKLPPEPWRKQEPIPTGEGRSITRNITILTTGKGNGGRELRVAGTGTDGKRGYYYKNIFAKQWKFKELDIPIKSEDIIENDQDRIHLAQSIRENYEGTVSFTNQLVLEASLENFTAHYAPSTIDPAIIKIRSGTDEIEVKLHMVNTWNAFFNPPGYPYHLPRTFLATLELPEKITVKDKKVNARLKQLYKQVHLNEFCFFVEAGEKYVRIHQRRGKGKKTVMNFVKEDGQLAAIEKRLFLNPLVEDKEKFLQLTREPHLLVKGLEKSSPAGEQSVAELKEKLTYNIDLYLQLTNFRQETTRNSVRAHFNALAFKLAQGFFFISGTILIPESMHLTKNMGILFNTHARKHFYMQLQSRDDYYNSIAVLKERMNLYFAELTKLNAGQHFINEYMSRLEQVKKTWLTECRRGFNFGNNYPVGPESPGFIAGWNIFHKMKHDFLDDEQKALKAAEKLFLKRFKTLYGKDHKQRIMVLKKLKR